ncbi:hypothetical protein JJE66_33740 [Bradyrhizobium diazoefficiens]|uniref:hypothetical protein n=1 Tax=Bradyrhizobium diazoefficiens TaxID=1355477 RepID=UPI00190A4808|nr:hypothetical protein [Bradyrhizobium diazoefficiens]MBK3666171.1 hypothetical protein [Bradyrhizobium diazoefficiens]
MADVQDDYTTTQGFAGYVSKPEITQLSPNYLVKGSRDVLVDYANRVISRNGYTLYNQANTNAGGIKGSFEWETSTGTFLSFRSFDHTLQFDWNGTYNSLLTNLRSPYVEFVRVLDFTEQTDVLLFVNGDGAQMHRWSGGVSKVRSSTSTTVTKQGVLTAVTTIAFNAGDGVSVAPTITNSSNSFVSAGFAAGDILHVAGSASNNSNFTIASVAAGMITLVMSDVLVSEAAGATVTLYNQTGPTWKSARFFSSVSGRAIVYNGVSYTYTGGETTDTLTGLTSFPTVTAGDSVWQASDTIALPSAITSADGSFYPDLIGTQLNIVYLGSTKSALIFGSKANDYTNFTLTSPRAQGDPILQPLTSGPCTCIIPVDTDRQILNIQNTLVFGSGSDSFDQIDFHMSADNTTELCRIIRYKTAKTDGVYSKNGICPIKNNTLYISNEPALVPLSQATLENSNDRRNVPLSDPIKDDFDAYDFTDSHVVYWKRAVYITVPSQGILLIYDMMRNLWQPPQYIPVSRLAVIDGWLYGHCSTTNETYKLFVGTNDNGSQIKQRARFAYNNGGSRTRVKSMSQYWTDGYITPNATITMYQYFGYNGYLGVKSLTITGSDESIAVLPEASPLGTDVFGVDPLGGASLSAIPGLPYSGSILARFYQIDTMARKQFVESYVEYATDDLDAQFAILAHGSNMQDSGTAHISHKK